MQSSSEFNITEMKKDLWEKLTTNGVLDADKLALIPEHIASNALADLNESGTNDRAKDLSTVFSRLESLDPEAAKEFLTEVKMALEGKTAQTTA